MTDAIDGEKFDIMLVYREDHGILSFSSYEEGNLIYIRDENWTKSELEE